MRVKRFCAMLLAALMAVSLLPASALAGAEMQEIFRDAVTVAAWDFESETNAASTADTANAEAVVVRESEEIAFTYSAGTGGNGTKALSSAGWSSATEEAPKYYSAVINASGYEGLSVSAAFRASNTGPKNISLFYSVDGENFTAVEEAVVELAGTAWGTLTGALPEDANGAEALTLRLAVTGTTSANGGTVAGNGTLRIDDLVITGTVVETPPAEPDPSAVWISQALAAENGEADVRVSGIVTFIDGRNVYIEDGTGGIVAYLNANASNLSLGDKIRVTGTRATYKGLPELSGIDQTNAEQFEVLSTGNALPVMDATVEEILNSTNDYLCRRVKITRAVMGAVNNNNNTPITQANSTINIYKMPVNDAVQGDYVNVTAVVGMFNTVQLRVALAADVEVANEEPEPTPPPTDEPQGSVTIAEALAAEVNTEGVCVIGVVTFIDGRNVYIQDATGGIVIYLNSASNSIALGDSVKATGKRATYKGLPELSGVDAANAEQFQILSNGNALPLEDVTIAALLANTDAYICERVRIVGAVMGAVNNGGNTPITQGEASINIYKMPVNDAVEGDSVNVTAVVGMFNTVQLRVALAADVQTVSLIPDPIDPADYPNYTTIANVLAMENVSGTATVVGQVTMKFGNYGQLNSVTLGDVENNKIVGFQVYDLTDITRYTVGNIVAVTGTLGVYGGVRQLSNITAVTVLSADAEPMAAQEVTITELKNNIADYLSEFVVIKDAVLGEYNSNGSTNISDADGNTLPIYRAAAYPEGVTAGDTVDVYAVASKYNANVQLRNGSANDYFASTSAYVNISDALAFEAGAEATVRGTVTFIDGRNVYVQDATGAIVLYLNSASDTVAVGDLVQAKGIRDTFRGLPELKNIDPSDEEQLKVISSGNTLPIETASLSAILADNAAYMCRRVRLEGVTLGAVNTGGNTPITQDGAQVNVYRIPATEFAEGDVVDMIAIVSCYNSVQLRVANAADITEHIEMVDPIPESLITDSVMTIREVIAAPDSTELTVIAQLVYRFGNYDSINSAILEDIIDGEVYGLQMYNSLDDYEIGDVLKISATKTTYGGVPQIQSALSVEKLFHADPIPAQTFNTFAEMLAIKDDLLSEYVKVRNVTLGAYNDNGSTIVTDSTGATMPIYRAASYANYMVQAGEVVDLCAALSKYSSTWQFRGGEYYGDNKAPEIVLGTFLDAAVGVDYDVAVTVIDDYGIESVTMTYVIGETTGSVPMEYNPTNSKYRATVPGEAITAGNAAMTLTFTALDNGGLSSETTAEVMIVDDPQIVEVFPKANSATYDDKTPEIKVIFANAGEAPDVTITVSGVEGTTSVEGNTAVFNYEGELADGKYNANVTIIRTDRRSVEFSWSFTVGEPQFGFYFGQLHSHTAEYSDGAGTLEDVFNYVTGLPESENVQFVAITDHSNYFDDKTNLGDFENVESGIIAANGHSKWYNYTTQIDGFNERQSNVIFLGGYEMTWSGQYGHINTFNSVGIVSRQNSIYTVHGGAGLVAYYDLIKQYPDTIHQFNHPGTTFGNFDNFGYYDVAADRVINMVEVGNGEGAVGGSAYWPSYEQYTLALDMGWHVAPSNNQDNHKGRWGNSNTARDVFITDDFSEEGIYEAMRNRTMYATEDKNLEIYYALNDCIMGTIIPEDEENPTNAVHIYASVNDPDGEGVGLVKVIVNGGITAYVEEFTGSSAIVDVTLPNDYSYYFIRVEQTDGDIAVTAPVWVGDVSKVGISDVTTETVIPVRGEEMTFTTTLYDYEADDFVIESVGYYIAVGQNDPVLLDLIENAGTVATNSELQLTFGFTPTALGGQKLNVVVTGYLGDTYMQFTHSYEMEVLDPSELLDVGIDAGHANFYVAGNYAGSDAAFIQLMAQNAIRTNYIRAGQLTYENIKDYRMIVLTVPYVGFQNVGAANLYSAAEIAAIGQYAANGGRIILCSKSDRGDPANAEEMAANISNAILEAIGTDTRIVRGIVVDNEEKANEAYRLYFTSEDNYNYTWNGEPVWLLKDVLETTNNSFSCYNGAPVAPGVNAIPVIKGYSTTWGASYTDNFTGSNYVPNYDTDTVTVPMGEVVEMTLEDLPGGGWLITSGVTFFSTFEVQVEVENATTLQNSNYQLVMNIIDKLMPEPTITPIAEVNAAEEGVKFTVEGYVTSNASGYDQTTAFFDCIYVQDDTAGINLFPVAGDFHIGQYVRVTGVTGSYNGERELVVSKIEAVEGHEECVIEPLELTAAEAMSTDYTGTLVMVEGTVAELGYSSDGALETIMVRDETGVSRVFIDGYIMSGYVLDLHVGDEISAVGLASITVDTENVDGGFIPRIRVRNRSEIVLKESEDLLTLSITEISWREHTTDDGKKDLRFLAEGIYAEGCEYEVTEIGYITKLGDRPEQKINCGLRFFNLLDNGFTYSLYINNIPDTPSVLEMNLVVKPYAYIDGGVVLGEAREDIMENIGQN